MIKESRTHTAITFWYVLTDLIVVVNEGFYIYDKVVTLEYVYLNIESVSVFSLYICIKRRWRDT